jgi:hypothetical protein
MQKGSYAENMLPREKAEKEDGFRWKIVLTYWWNPITVIWTVCFNLHIVHITFLLTYFYYAQRHRFSISGLVLGFLIYLNPLNLGMILLAIFIINHSNILHKLAVITNLINYANLTTAALLFISYFIEHKNWVFIYIFIYFI